MIKIDRFSAWVLYFSMLTYFISGYGMTKGIIDPKLATSLHADLLPYLIVISFLIHTGYAIHMAFKRWKIWNIPTKSILIIAYLCLFGLFIYIESVYLEKKANTESFETSSPSVSPISSPVSTTNTTPSASEKVFTVDELSKYNGQNGTPAYVAVDGIVYDMTDVFVNGTHYSHIAGTQLTDEFYLKHIESEITKYPVVGKLKQ